MTLFWIDVIGYTVAALVVLPDVNGGAIIDHKPPLTRRFDSFALKPSHKVSVIVLASKFAVSA